MTTHTTGGIRLIASACAVGLVVASAGFGAVFAWQIGIQHGILLACLTVLFAVALEGIKPLAINAALQALGSWSLVRGMALLLLGAIAIIYSLTSELSLMAGSRGDLSAKREQASDASRRALESHQRAKQELATLNPSRPVGELEALAAAAAPICRVHVTSGSRQTVCGKPAGLVAELGRAKRKSELEAVLERSDDTLARTPAVKASDPGSQALGTYLAALGINVPVGILAQWLNLVPVLALELGSALAVVLVNAMPRGEPPIAVLEPTPVNHVVQPAIPLLPKLRNDVQRLLLNRIKDHGGSIAGSERQLASYLGTSKPTLRRSLHALRSSGAIHVTAGRKGTQITLMA